MYRKHSTDPIPPKGGKAAARHFILLAVDHRFQNPETRIHKQSGREYTTRWVDCVAEINPNLESVYGLDKQQAIELTTEMCQAGEIIGRAVTGGYRLSSAKMVQTVPTPKVSAPKAPTAASKLLAALGM